MSLLTLLRGHRTSSFVGPILTAAFSSSPYAAGGFSSSPTDSRFLTAPTGVGFTSSPYGVSGFDAPTPHGA